MLDDGRGDVKDGDGARPGRWCRRLRRLAALALAAAVLFAICWWAFPPPLEKIRGFPASLRVLDRRGEVLRVYPSALGEMRFPVELEDVCRWLQLATIAVEDQRFYSHPGVDPLAVVRALAQNVRRLEVHSGASTLTMQLVRIVEQRPRTLVSKAVETFHALQITARTSKDETLRAYLNLAPYGGNLRGVEAAARRYFGKGARDLSLGEAALIAGLPQAPSRLRPDRHYERALARRRLVLEAMLREGFIDEGQFARADADRPPVDWHPWPFAAPHAADLALGESRGRRSASASDPATIRPSDVYTTIDLAVQRSAAAHLRRFLVESSGGRERLNGAVVVLETRNASGVACAEVRALVGTVDFFDRERRGQVSGATARRSPGSTLKPFLYAQAFDLGRAAPSTVLADVPTPYLAYLPENFDRRFHGPVAAAEALARSLNVPAVRLQQRVGTERFVDCLRRLSVRGVDRGARRYGLTLTLGGAEVRLLDLTAAYGCLGRGGLHLPWRLLPDPAPRPPERVFSAASAYLVVDALSRRGHLERAGVRGGALRPGAAAYKTGTSFGLRDAWAFAFSSRRVVGVWLGDPRGPPHPDLVGLEAAAPVALAILEELGPSAPWERPASLVDRRVCTVTGYLVGRFCPASRGASFPRGAPAVGVCQVHRQVIVDPHTGHELCAACRRGRGELRVVESWPNDVARWFAGRGLASSRLPHDPRCGRMTRRGDPPRILSPLEGSEFRFLPGVSFRQALSFSAAVAADSSSLHWFVDGELFARTTDLRSVSWPLRPGTHEVRCVDDGGRSSSVSFRVYR